MEPTERSADLSVASLSLRWIDADPHIKDLLNFTISTSEVLNIWTYFILVSTIFKSFCLSVHRFVSDLEFSQTLSFFHLLEAVLLEANSIDVNEAS